MRNLEQLHSVPVKDMNDFELRIYAVFAAQQLGFWALAKLWAEAPDILEV